MMLDLQAIADFPARITLEEDSSQMDISVEGLSLTGMARVELHIVQSDNIYYCTGVVACEARIECSRCLDKYGLTLRGELDFSIREAADKKQAGRADTPDGELLAATRALRIDISEPVREAILLEVPLKPLCREDCGGICPHCGVNRNDKSCDCRGKNTDPRWDALSDLR